MASLTKSIIAGMTLAGSVLLGACSTVPKEDPYVLYRQHMPKSILVFPPVNNSVEVNAPYSWVTTVSKPLAEQGYYVFPVGVIDEFMKSNGLPNPEDMRTAPLDKIHQIFGADAVLYVTLEQFGQKFEILQSTTRVDAVAQLVDVKTAQVIWEGSLDYAQRNKSNGGGLIGALIDAAITQVGSQMADVSHNVAKQANRQLFQNKRDGLLVGPRHPDFEELETTAVQ